MAKLINNIPNELLFILPIIVAIMYFYFIHSFSYFTRRNIPFLKPSFPFGDFNLNFIHGYGQELQKFYETFKKKGAKFGGFYLATKPVFFPLDPELLKKILTKDFKYFYNRGIYVNEEIEYITAHLYSIQGAEWKSLRNKFSSSFSPCKLKNMFGIIPKLEEKLVELSSTSTAFEGKDLATRITTDMFCSIGFGMECTNLANSNAGFPKCSEILYKNHLYNSIKLILAVIAPELLKRLNLYFVESKFQKFVMNAITEVVEYREKNPGSPEEITNLLIKYNDNTNDENVKKNTMRIKHLIAQCFILFVAGFNTSANTINYCLFELTQNQSLQSKLRHEIQDTFKKNNGKLNYETIMQMPLLDKVISETLRKYPPVAVLNRECKKDYIIPGTKSVIDVGTSIMISVLGLHYDPEYYPDPEKFDPERFSEEAKLKRHPYTFMPFGEGPKNCIGIRLGLLQAKIGITYLLKGYKYTLNCKTDVPLKFKTDGVLLSTDGDIWFHVTRL